MSRLPWQPVWFWIDRFLYDDTECPPFDVPAYSGTFREHPSMRRLQLCMLHTVDIPRTFPDTSYVEDTYVKCFTEQTGLSLHGKVSYGYCCITCCRREWIGWYCFHCGKQRWSQLRLLRWLSLVLRLHKKITDAFQLDGRWHVLASVAFHWIYIHAPPLDVGFPKG